jgi:sugar phosphate permease
MMKLSSHWMAPRHFALASGMALFLGILGAVFAGTPLRLLVVAYDWRSVMLVSSLFPFVAAALIWIIVRDDPSERGYLSYAPKGTADKPRAGIMTGLKQVFGYRNMWLLLIAPGALVGSVLTFAGLWGVPFLTTHYGMSAPKAAAVCSALLISWAVGGPVCGTLSDRIGQRKPLYLIGCAALTLSWALIIFVPGLPIAALVTLLILSGFSAGSIIIGFAFVKESVPTHLAGTASGVCNMGVMLGPMLLQPIVGWILDRQWQGTIVAGVRTYELNAFRAGFAFILIWAIVALVCIVFSRETHCRQME